MDLSKIKESLGRLSFIADYSSLVVPLLIGLAAVLLMIPTQLISSRLKERMTKESVSARGMQIQSLLDNYAVSEQWKEERQYQDAYSSDANRISRLSAATTQREPLNNKIFPELAGTSQFLFQEFGNDYRKGIESLLAEVSAGLSPTESELSKALDTSGGRSGEYSSGYHHRSDYDEDSESIVDALCTEKADNCRVYINPSDIAGYNFWQDYEYIGTSKAVEDCWQWQLGFWIIEDVIKTVSSMNGGAVSVLRAPVKRVVYVGFTRDYEGGRVSSSRGYSGGAADTAPKYATGPQQEPLAVPFTGRFCNDYYDVVHFTVKVVLNADDVFSFMEELCSSKEHKFDGRTLRHNQITILESKIVSIERKSDEHKLYRYGSNAVVEMNLICEYLFNKAGYKKMKPAEESAGFEARTSRY